MSFRDIFKLYLNYKNKIMWIIYILLFLIVIISRFFIHHTIPYLIKNILFFIIGYSSYKIFTRINIMQKIFSIFQETKKELNKIIWPKIKETFKTTWTIIFITIFSSLIIWIIDGILFRIISFLIKSKA